MKLFRGNSQLKSHLASLKAEDIADAFTSNPKEIRLAAAISTAVLLTTNTMCDRLAQVFRECGMGLPGLLSRFQTFPFAAVAFEDAAYCHAVLKFKFTEESETADASFIKMLTLAEHLTSNAFAERIPRLLKAALADRSTRYFGLLIVNPQEALADLESNLKFALSDCEIRIGNAVPAKRNMQILSAAKFAIGIDHQAHLPGLEGIVRHLQKMGPELPK